MPAYINVTQLTEIRQHLYEKEVALLDVLSYNFIGPNYQLAVPLFNVYPIEVFFFLVAYFRICYLRAILVADFTEIHCNL